MVLNRCSVRLDERRSHQSTSRIFYLTTSTDQALWPLPLADPNSPPFPPGVKIDRYHIPGGVIVSRTSYVPARDVRS